MAKSSAEQVVEVARSLHVTVTDSLRKVDPLILVIGAVGGTIVFLRVCKLWNRSEKPLHKRLAAYAFSIARQLPWVHKRIEKEMEPARTKILEDIHKDDIDRVFIKEIPEDGMSHDAVVELSDKYNDYGQFDVRRGMVSGTVYTDIAQSHLDLLSKMYTDYAFSNPLHPDVFPGVRKMEAEVIRMVLNMFNAPAESSGSFTTGGTESIILACYAYRNLAYSRGISDPVILAPLTAHAAFDKAAILCGMRIRHVPMDKNNRVDVKAMKSMINSDVCMLVGSAPNFPTGTVDPIERIAELGQNYNIPVHVDACLGSFLIPFMEEAGFPLETKFDFRVPGVTSISCDTHKYGCAPKGSSVVMYRNRDVHHHQFFSVPEWVGGIYATPTIVGSRVGASAAATWATLLFFGRKEYVKRTRMIIQTAREVAEGIRDIPELLVHGVPDVSVVAFRSRCCNIYAIGDRLHKLGYNLNSLQEPDAIHVCLTINHASPEARAQFLLDLRKACKEVMALPDKGASSATAALYGMAAAIPDKSMVGEMAFAYLDACYDEPPVLRESDRRV